MANGQLSSSSGASDLYDEGARFESRSEHRRWVSYFLGLGAVAKLRQATTSFVMSVCLPFRPSALNNSAPI
jgi:hypothetical protein